MYMQNSDDDFLKWWYQACDAHLFTVLGILVRVKETLFIFRIMKKNTRNTGSFTSFILFKQILFYQIDFKRILIKSNFDTFE